MKVEKLTQITKKIKKFFKQTRIFRIDLKII